jgi:hypothetical protein
MTRMTDDKLGSNWFSGLQTTNQMTRMTDAKLDSNWFSGLQTTNQMTRSKPLNQLESNLSSVILVI